VGGLERCTLATYTDYIRSKTSPGPHSPEAAEHISRVVPDGGSSSSRSPTMASYDENGNDGLKKIGNVTIGSIAGDEARQGTDHEHRLSFLEAIRLYPSAVGWTIYFSLGVRCCLFHFHLV
jgi:hypothetical protein